MRFAPILMAGIAAASAVNLERDTATAATAAGEFEKASSTQVLTQPFLGFIHSAQLIKLRI
jgi:hypothetical protein